LETIVSNIKVLQI